MRLGPAVPLREDDVGQVNSVRFAERARMKIKFNWIALFIFTMMLIGCGPSVAVIGEGTEQTKVALPTDPPTITATYKPTLTPTHTATSTPTETSTPRPTEIPTTTPTNTATLIPTETKTPRVTIIEQSPYLLYDTSWGGPIQILNAGFNNRKQIELPEDVNIDNLHHAVSPDGKWLAFHTGTSTEPFDITLNLLSITDGSIYPIVKLLSEEYPDDLSVVTDYYLQLYGSAAFLRGFIFEDAIRTFAWSPDGQYLAFAGQMDGPSTDLYIYSIETGEIQRLTEDLRMLNGISWSPNGEWILIYCAIPGEIYIGETLHRIKVDGGTIKNPSVLEEGFWWQGAGWFSSTLYLLGDQGNGGPGSDLRYVDVETGKMTYLWTDVYEVFSIDPENNIIALSTNPSGWSFASSEPHAEDGLYIISADGSNRKVSDDHYWQLFFRGGDASRFIAWGGKGIVLIDGNGSAKSFLDSGKGNVSVSPDHRWLVVYENPTLDSIPGIELYSSNDQYLRTIPDLIVSDIIWQENSAGMFITTDKQLYYVTVPDGELILVDQCESEDDECWFSKRNIVWVP